MIAAAAQQSSLVVRQPGQFVTVQDGGRLGWRRYGVSRSGAMDPLSLAAANVLVGNPPQAPALEFMFRGGEYELAAEMGHVAVAGGSFTVFRNSERVCAYRSIRLVRGDLLRIGGSADAVWGYVAVAGGVVVPSQLGSVSTHVRSGLGGLAGRALIEGDTLPVGHHHPTAGDEQGVEYALYTRKPALSPEIRIVLGPQDEYFEPASVREFLAEKFVVTHRVDRMGYNFLGPALRHARGADVVSDGIVAGSIQVPGSGQLIALLADCQPTGGYPKIATVVSADLGRLAQSRPGSAVRFRAVTVEEAHRARLAFLQRIEELPKQVIPMRWEQILHTY